MTSDRAGGSDPLPSPTATRDVGDLLRLMSVLRTPEIGCPWDLEQSFATIARYTIEEAYEVADAIGRGDLDDLRDELGDLLLQVVFQARLAEEQGAFDFGGVVEAISAKLIRRHPHVFGDVRTLSTSEVDELWAAIKRQEREARAATRPPEPESVLDGVPAGLPALARADRLTRKAAAVGFTWPDIGGVLAKVDEEIGELKDAVAGNDRGEIEAELGDALFTLANLAREFGIDPETALAATNRKFERRFKGVEAVLAAEGRTPADASLEEMDALWVRAKEAERDPAPVVRFPDDGDTSSSLRGGEADEATQGPARRF